MYCREICNLTQVYLEQKLGDLDYAPPSLLVLGRNLLLKIPTLLEIESETAANEAVSLPQWTLFQYCKR